MHKKQISYETELTKNIYEIIKKNRDLIRCSVEIQDAKDANILSDKLQDRGFIDLGKNYIANEKFVVPFGNMVKCKYGDSEIPEFRIVAEFQPNAKQKYLVNFEKYNPLEYGQRHNYMSATGVKQSISNGWEIVENLDIEPNRLPIRVFKIIRNDFIAGCPETYKQIVEHAQKKYIQSIKLQYDKASGVQEKKLAHIAKLFMNIRGA